MWFQSELGALSVRLIPQSDTSARTNAPDEKVICKRSKFQRNTTCTRKCIKLSNILTALVLTHSDFASLVGLCDLDVVLAKVSALHRQLRLSFAHFPFAHVKGDDVAAVPRHEAAHAGGGVHQAATLPLTDVDLKWPEAALVEDKGSYLIVLVVPGSTITK